MSGGADRVDVQALAQVAEEAALAAGEVLLKHFGRAHIEYKGVVDLVTNADKESEATIIGLIRSEFPGHGILAEESGSARTEHDVRWIIDPIDGTTNYAHGLPIFAVSIAAEVRGRIEVGIIYNPVTKEKYQAVRGRGATFNGAPMGVSKTAVLDTSLLLTGFPYSVRETKLNFDHFEHFVLRTQAVRRLGSAAMDMAYVARGGVDGYWETEINAWDIAAGWLIVEEAGGRVTDLHGRPFQLDVGHITATNGHIHDDVLSVVKLGRSGLSSGSSSRR